MEYNEDVDVVLVGENHGVAAHGDEVYSIVQDVEPEYVVLEATEDADMEQRMKHLYHFQTLERTNQVVEARTGDYFAPDPEMLHNVLQYRREQAERNQTGVIPETPEALMHTRISEMDEVYRQGLDEYAINCKTEADNPGFEDISTIFGRFNSRHLNGRRARTRFVDNIYEDICTGRFTLGQWEDTEVREKEEAIRDELTFNDFWNGTAEEQLHPLFRQRERKGAQNVAEYVAESDRPLVVVAGENHLNAYNPDAVFEEELAAQGVNYAVEILEGTIDDDIAEICGNSRASTAD